MKMITKVEAKREIDKASGISRISANNVADVLRALGENKQCVVLVIR